MLVTYGCFLQTLSSVTTSSGGPSLFSTMMLSTGGLQVNSINVTSLAYMPGISTSDQAAAAAQDTDDPNIGVIVGPVVGGVALLAVVLGVPCLLGLSLMYCAPAVPCRVCFLSGVLLRRPEAPSCPLRLPPPLRLLHRLSGPLRALAECCLLALEAGIVSRCHATFLCVPDPAHQ